MNALPRPAKPKSGGRREVSLRFLSSLGIEALTRGGSGTLSLPAHTILEVPSSLKWTQYEHSLELGAFSYHVSGYAFGARIGRYCSFGENVQIGRQNHPMSWASTSPAFYLGNRLFSLGSGWRDAEAYQDYAVNVSAPPTQAKLTTIGNDVWIGHGALICAGVSVGDGAVIGAHAVVTTDVPPYAVVAGNPATIKRSRLPPELISPMLRARWWRFAPWQLSHLDPAKPEAFLRQVFKLAESEPVFEPEVVDLREQTE